ncbi:MAG: phosphatase PAP2 family protein [Thermoleophilia bacterium]|nr:phosphatase PAP2 family protein [Thermoleophilia bacterium]
MEANPTLPKSTNVDDIGADVVSGSGENTRAHAPSGAPLLEAREGGMADRFAGAVGPVNPIRVFLAAILGGYAILVALTIAAGFLLTEVLLSIGAVASADERISLWLERERTETLVDLSWLGSTLAGGVVIPALVGTLLVLFLVFRHWRLAAFTLFVILLESGTYRVTTLVVHRDRPDVERLEGLPVDASFPSGHTAASVALFGGLLLVLASRIENAALRAALWIIALVIPAFVMWSRMLRGMHYATDVTAGVLMGVGALVVVVFAARAAGAAAAHRDAMATTRGSRP